MVHPCGSASKPEAPPSLSRVSWAPPSVRPDERQHLKVKVKVKVCLTYFFANFCGQETIFWPPCCPSGPGVLKLEANCQKEVAVAPTHTAVRLSIDETMHPLPGASLNARSQWLDLTGWKCRVL